MLLSSIIVVLGVAIVISLCHTSRVANRINLMQLFLGSPLMCTIRKHLPQDVQRDSTKTPTVRVELKPLVGQRVTVKAVLEKIGKWNHFLNPVFQKLQVQGTDITVHHAHVRQIDFPAGKKGVKQLKGTEQQLYSFTGVVGPYEKTDDEGNLYEDYRFEHLFNVKHIEEPDLEEYELWYQEMGYTTPPSSQGYFKKNDDDSDDYIVC